MESVVVTGVSSGIGWGIAKVLTARGLRVFGSVRRKCDAERLEQQLGSRFCPLLFDVTDASAVEEAVVTVDAALKGGGLLGLVNNAGIAVAGPLLEISLDELRYQLEVNLIAPLLTTRAFGTLLGVGPSLARRPGRVINISSLAGRLAPPFLGPYAISKHGLEGLSESLRRELMLYGIDVIIVAPGNVATSIWDKAQLMEFSQYEKSPYFRSLIRAQRFMIKSGRSGWPPERLGAVVYEALTAKRPKVRYAPVAGKLFNWTIPALLPSRFLDRRFAKAFGLFPENPLDRSTPESIITKLHSARD